MFCVVLAVCPFTVRPIDNLPRLANEMSCATLRRSPRRGRKTKAQKVSELPQDFALPMTETRLDMQNESLVSEEALPVATRMTTNEDAGYKANAQGRVASLVGLLIAAFVLVALGTIAGE